MPFFRNPHTGEVSAFYGEDAVAALQSGYTPVDDRPVEVSGGSVSAEDVPELQKYRGLATDDPFETEEGRYGRLQDKRLQDEFGQTGGQVRAFGEGIASGATLGLYDVVADKLGFESDKYAQANPDARMGGELTGMLGSALAAPAGAGRLAAVLAKTPAGYMSVKAAQFGKNIGGLAGSAAGAAAEGAGYAAVQTLSKALIQDEPLAAETVFAEFGKNALFGAGIGAGAAVLAGGLAKVASKLDDAGETVAPLLDLSSDASRAKVKRLGAALQKVDNLGDDIVRKFEGKPVEPYMPSVDELPLRRGHLSADDLPDQNFETALPGQGPAPFSPTGGPAVVDDVLPPRVDEVRTPPDESWRDPANPPLQRMKLAKSVGDQVTDELLMVHNDGRTVGQIKKAYAKANDALALARETKSKGAVTAAFKHITAYENEVRAAAGKIGRDVSDQFAAADELSNAIGTQLRGGVGQRTARNMEAIEGVAGTTGPSTKLPGQKTPFHNPVYDDLTVGQPATPARPHLSVPDEATTLAPHELRGLRAQPGDPSKVNPVLGSLDQYGQPTPLLTTLDDFKAFGADLKISRQLTREALGATSKADLLSHKSITHLLDQEPAQMLATLGRMDEYFTALRKTAEATGDARVMQRIEKALLEIDDQLDELTGGIHLDDVERDSIGTALGSDALKKPEFSNPTSDRLHSMGALSKLTHDVKLKPGRTKRSMLNGLVVSAGARAAARGGSYAARGLAGSGLGGAVAGGVAAASGYHAVHALANLVGGAGGRIKSAVTKLAKGTSYAANKLARPASLTAAYLLRQSSFEYQPDKAGSKPVRKTLQEAFLDRAEELTRAASNPDATQKAIHDDLAGLRMVAPGVADELEMLSLKVPLYLAGKMPKDPGSVIRFGKSLWRPSDYEVLQFGEHMRGAMAPIEVYEEALEGTITPQAAEAVRTLYPRLFEQMQLEIMSRSDELRGKLDLQSEVRISVLTDVPVTSVMRPQFRSFMAERAVARAEASSAQGSKLGPSGSSGPSAAEPMTGAQQLLK